MSDPTALKGLLETVDHQTPVYAGRVPKDAPQGRFLAVYDTGAIPEGRMILAPARGVMHRWSVVCVNNTPLGASVLAWRVYDLLDGARIEGDLLRADLVSAVIEDRDDPSEWRWSSTVEVSQHRSR